MLLSLAWHTQRERRARDPSSVDSRLPKNDKLRTAYLLTPFISYPIANSTKRSRLRNWTGVAIPLQYLGDPFLLLKMYAGVMVGEFQLDILITDLAFDLTNNSGYMRADVE